MEESQAPVPPDLLSPRTSTSPSAWWGEGQELPAGDGKGKSAKVEV